MTSKPTEQESTDRDAGRGFSLPLRLPLRFDSAPKIERYDAAKGHPTSDELPPAK